MQFKPGNIIQFFPDVPAFICALKVIGYLNRRNKLVIPTLLLKLNNKSP